MALRTTLVHATDDDESLYSCTTILCLGRWLSFADHMQQVRDFGEIFPGDWKSSEHPSLNKLYQ